MSMIHFLSFATTNMKPTLKRIGKEANDSCFFDRLWLFNEKDIYKSFIKERKDFFENYKRGYGYWLWKPYIINYVLGEKMNDGDILVYLDSGSEIHKTGAKRWGEYKEMLKSHSLLTFDHLHSFENQFTKRDVLDFFGVTNDHSILESRQLWAGGLIMRKDVFVCNLMRRWLDVCDTYKYTLLCDEPSKQSELPQYKQHCHDQSIFSVICKIEDIAATEKNLDGRIKVLPMQENYPYPCDWNTMDEFPFWAKRNKSFTPPTLFQRIKRRLIR